VHAAAAGERVIVRAPASSVVLEWFYKRVPVSGTRRALSGELSATTCRFGASRSASPPPPPTRGDAWDVPPAREARLERTPPSE
jgi:hypothetical protein